MADFPNAVKNFLQLQDGVDSVVAQHPNDRGDEITAAQTMMGAMGAVQTNTESYKNLLLDQIKGCRVKSDTVAQVTIALGRISIPDASDNVRFRVNSSVVTVTWADIDTGAEEASKRYYVYAVADAAGTEFTALISLSATTPTGATFYRLLGSFYNNSGSDIEDVNDDEYLLTKETGVMEEWTKTTPPDGALLCDGTVTVGTTNDPTLSDLYDIIGIDHGGSDATDFQLPDRRGRVAVGLDNMGGSSANVVTDANADTIGGVFGAETHTLSTAEMPAHTHTDTMYNANGWASGDNVQASNATNSAGNLTTNSTGGGGAHNNLQPSMAEAIIIWK